MASRGPPALERSEILDRLARLKGYDRIVYSFGRLLAATSGITIKPVPRAKTATIKDMVLEYLKRIGARDFDTGQSAAQIAKKLGYSSVYVSQALSRLIEQKLVIGEQRGRHIRYYLP